MSQPTLYRMYNRFDVLLYVGRTINSVNRLRDHRLGKDWWDDIFAITLEQFDTHDELAEAEATAIQTEHPVHNVVGGSLRIRIADIGREIDKINGTPAGTSLESIYWCYWPPEMCTPSNFEMVYAMAVRDLKAFKRIAAGCAVTEAFDQLESSLS